ncbi:B12-binding domain-containing protein [Streptomyces sp. N35]|uniref:cobalamin B12-binding domain-containing protein n=1 Tax=Streptomyces sp. N35 TaxID=2795730 RepID=UPI0018F74780|nr:cobalamin B12-binding domain-containing protein [Streptomyces sp. N35]
MTTISRETVGLAEAGDRLWDALIHCDETHAVTTVRTAVSAFDGDVCAAVEHVLLGLIAPAQARVGRAWAANELTVAQEHAATAINERCVAALVDDAADALPAPARGRAVVACVDGEWHALPARLVAEVLRLRGWRVDYLGAQVPTDHLVAHLHESGAETVLLSSSLPSHLPTAHSAISACLAIGVPVVAGGAAFGPGGRYARLLKAQWAGDAAAAADLLAKGLRRPRPEAAHLPDLDLPHLKDQEYTMVRRTRTHLVKQALADVEHGFAAMRSYDERRRERTAEDLDHIVGFLATALYVDDADLFTTFVTWTAGILSARGVPPQCLLPALDSLRHQLGDFPRAVGILTAARHALVVPPPGRAA